MRRLALLAAAGMALGATGCTLNRPDDPVVLTGAQCPRCRACAAGRRRGLPLDRGLAPGARAGRRAQDGRPRQVYNGTPTGFITTVYADPGTFTGADSNAERRRRRRDRLHGQGRRPRGARRRRRPSRRGRRQRREGEGAQHAGRPDAGRLDLPVQAQRRPEPRRRQAVRELHVQPALGRLQDDLQAPGRAEPRELDGHHAQLLGALLRPLAQRPDPGEGRRRQQVDILDRAKARLVAGQLRPQRGHLRRRRGRVHRRTRAAPCGRSAPTSAPTAAR